MRVDLHDLFPPDQVDQVDPAAAVIAAFLQELALQFESAYCAEIRRHHDRQPRHVDPSQPWLFAPADDPERASHVDTGARPT